MKIIHIVPRISAEASGPAYSVPKLCESLAGRGEEVELHVLAPAPANAYFQHYTINAHTSCPLLPRLGISPSMRKALSKAAKTAQIMHNHSLWMLPNIYPSSAVKGTQCRLVTSPRGTLSGYAINRSRRIKSAVWVLGQKNVLRKSACLHATAESEYHEIRRNGLHPPVAIIPNGIEISPEQKHQKSAKQFRRLLFLGRIHPIKGIDLLLRAWVKLGKRYSGWELHIVGPDNCGYSSQIKALAEELKIKKITFPGPVYGSEKRQAYSSADLYVLPTHSENFGMTVAEALANGVPAIVSKGAPWAGLEKEKCGWWIDIGEEPLVECLGEAMSKSSKELVDMGMRGREWMNRDFSWDKIGKMMHKTYEWVLGGGTPPAWVVTD